MPSCVLGLHDTEENDYVVAEAMCQMTNRELQIMKILDK